MAQNTQNNSFEYRDELTIPKHVNFGLELELDKIDPDRVYKLVKSEIGNDWQVKSDVTLTDGKSAEIVSPILHNDKDTWIILRKVSELLYQLDADYDKCSFQVNYDGYFLPSVQEKLDFLKFFSMYEDIVYRFSKGEDCEYRYSLEIYAHPIFSDLKHAVLAMDKGFNFYTPEFIIDTFSGRKRYGVEFKTNNQDLIEFRTPNMTNNPLLWQNYINTFYHMLVATSNGNYNKEAVEQYIKNVDKMYLLENYELEKKEKALNFCDIIFEDSIDKNSFMQQYLRENHPKSFYLNRPY